MPGEDRKARAATLFDVRRIIGGLLGVYGLLLVVLGLNDSDAEIEKAQGVHINLWAGIGMLVVAALFWAWALWRPLGEELREASEDEPGGPSEAPPPRGVDAAALASAAERARQQQTRRGRRGRRGS
jgi:hypothetical protein